MARKKKDTGKGRFTDTDLQYLTVKPLDDSMMVPALTGYLPDIEFPDIEALELTNPDGSPLLPDIELPELTYPGGALIDEKP